MLTIDNGLIKNEMEGSMKVKVGNKIYDSKNEPVMVILSETEKVQIADMAKDNKCYCQYPDASYWTNNNYANIVQWMMIC